MPIYIKDLANSLDLQDTEGKLERKTFLAADKSRVEVARKSVRTDQISRRDALVKKAEDSNGEDLDEDDDSLETFNFNLVPSEIPPTPKAAMFETSGKVQTHYPGSTVPISSSHKTWFGKILVAAAMVHD